MSTAGANSLKAADLRLFKAAEARFPTRFGNFRIYGFVSRPENGPAEEAVVLTMGDLGGDPPPLLRIHSQCLTGDVFHSLRCDCRGQLEMSLERIAGEGRGMLLYEEQEGRGIGLMNKLRSYELQDGGADTVEANEQLGFESDLRRYSMPVAILRYFGLTSVRLLSNNMDKINALAAAGIKAERVPCEVAPTDSTAGYLKTKKEKMGHLLEGF